MKYLFKFIFGGLYRLLELTVWFLFNAAVFIWHVDTKHFIPAKDFDFCRSEFMTLRWTVIYLVLAIIAAIFGWAGMLSAHNSSVCQIFFFIFLTLFVLSLIFHKDEQPA